MVTRYWPLERGHLVTSPFGSRDGGFHAGTDFGWPGGSANKPVFAVQSGTVLYAGAADGYGGPDPAGWLVIDSSDAEGGGCVEYGHIVREVAVGQHVIAGQRIARINPDTRTNAGVAPHLHLSVMPREYNPGKKLDPVPWLRDAIYPGTTTPTPPKPGGTPVGKPAYREIDMMTGGGRGTRSRPPRHFYLHTEEGNSSAEQLARYCDGSHDVSYHYTLRDRVLCDVVDTDYYSWSVLDENVFSINLCFAGSRAGWTTAQWMARSGDIDIAAWIAVQDCRKYGIPTIVYGPGKYGELRTKAGISDHRGVTKGLGIGDHLDVGDGFPWAYFISKVNEYANPTPPPEDDDIMAALSPEEQRELLENTRWIKAQLGPKDPAWTEESSLGKNSKGQERTLRDGVAAALRSKGV